MLPAARSAHHGKYQEEGTGIMTAAEAFQMAGQFYQTGQLAPAEQMYHYVLELEPNHGGALFALGTLALHAGRWGQAIGWMRKATEARPNRADYWHDLGVAYLQTGALSEAEACCQKALRLRPDYTLAANDLALIYMRKGEVQRAIEWYRLAPGETLTT
jgi:tetratricopeptide (TPR) repeat protein